MKVVHVCNTDIKGGAARAAYALNSALILAGVDSKMLVQRKFSKNSNIFSVSDNALNKQLANYRMILDMIPIQLFTNKEMGRFSFGNIGLNIASHQIIRDADIIHLHWINEGFLSVKNIERLELLNKPIVWTFHDMWGFTGGCHYSGDCRNYEVICMQCPYLKNPADNDFSTQYWKRKQSSFNSKIINIITCSKWLADVAKSSSLLKHFNVLNIPNTLNINAFKPHNRLVIRKKLTLDKNKFLLLFGTINTKDKRKGFSFLIESLNHIKNNYPSVAKDIEVLILGTSSDEEMDNIPFRIIQLGRIDDEYKIAEFYSAADIFIAPSIEDNLPNTVMESLACGVPVVAFNVGGIPEMVDHQLNGYLAMPGSSEDLANGIHWFYEKKNNMEPFKINAAKKVISNFSPEIIARKHVDFYKMVMSKTKI